LIVFADRRIRWVMIVCINKRNNVVLLISITAPLFSRKGLTL